MIHSAAPGHYSCQMGGSAIAAIAVFLNGDMMRSRDSHAPTHGGPGSENRGVAVAFCALGIAVAMACGLQNSPPDGGDAGADSGAGLDAYAAQEAGTDGSRTGGGATPTLDGGSGSGVSGGSGGARDSGDSSRDEGGGGTGDGSSATGACSGTGVQVPAAERVSNGNPLLPPKWAFGILWGSYYDQTGSSFAQNGNILAAATQLRAQFSGDLMWIDSSWLWHNYSGDPAGTPNYISFTFDPLTFPDPATMIQTLQQNHFHFGVWEWPWEDHGSPYFQDGVSNKYFVMNGADAALATTGWHGDPNPAEFDFTNPATVSWWTGLNKPLTDWGLDFLKLDTTVAQQTSPISAGQGQYFNPTKNYQHERNGAAYELTKLYPASHNPDAMMNGARGFIMPKAASPGNDQFPGWWTDDTDATWAYLATEMGRASQLDTSTTAAYWCGDTGGYNDVPTDELYIRWLEYSAFTPLQEFFGGKAPGIGARFPWLFGTQAQQIQRQYSDLRYRLLPFRYSNALIAYEVSPVAYPVTWVGSTQLLVGNGSSQILVQPVTTQGATTASVKLPADATWIDYWTGQSYAGGTTAAVAAPLDQEPVFVKAGAIIPMGPVEHYVGEHPADPLTLAIYPAGSTNYTLYEDDGISEGYLGGAYSTTKFSSDATGAHPVITIGAQATAKYAYTGQLCSRTYILEIHGQAAAPTAVTRDGHAEPTLSAAAFDGGAQTEGWYYDSVAQTVWVEFLLSSAASTSVAL
jgi:alpha-glucosidase